MAEILTEWSDKGQEQMEGIVIGTDALFSLCSGARSAHLSLPRCGIGCDDGGMFRGLLSALLPRKGFGGLRMSLVLEPSKAVETSGVRLRFVLGGKVIDVVREGESSSKERLL